MSSRVGEIDDVAGIVGRMGGEEADLVMPGDKIGGRGEAGIEGRKGSRMV